jgi:phospholipase/lecithinase/hemolysin
MMAYGEPTITRLRTLVNIHNAKLSDAAHLWSGAHKGTSVWLYNSHSAFTGILDAPDRYGIRPTVTEFGKEDDFWKCVLSNFCHPCPGIDEAPSDDYHPSSKAQVLFGEDVLQLLMKNQW